MGLGAYGSLLLLGAIWGASFLLIKIGVAEMGPMTLAALRTALGAVVLGVILAARREPLSRNSRLWRRLALMAALGIAVPFAAISWGTQHIASSLSAILNAAMPLFTFCIVALSGGEATGLRRLVGVLLGLGGILILVLPQLLQGGVQATVLGQLAVVLAALSYALAVVYANRHLTNESPLHTSFGQLTLAALMLAPLALFEDSWRAAITYRSIGAVAVLGVLGTALAYLVYYRLIRQAGATFTSLVTYITPVFGVFWGRLILNERLSWNAFAALGLILGGLLLVRGRPAAPKAAAPEGAALAKARRSG
jgi:drug/metabolite transporter (DMT)-like permease